MIKTLFVCAMLSTPSGDGLSCLPFVGTCAEIEAKLDTRLVQSSSCDAGEMLLYTGQVEMSPIPVPRPSSHQ